MKLIEALRNVERSEDASSWVDVEEICESLGIDPWQSERPKDSDVRLKHYWLQKWNCTDTWVGIRAIFFDGELVGMAEQQARKSDVNYSWLSQAHAHKVWDYLRPKFPKVENVIDESAEISQTYTVGYVSEIIQTQGFYQGVPCELVRDELYLRNARHYKFDGDNQDVTLQFADGSTTQIHVGNFAMPTMIGTKA